METTVWVALIVAISTLGASWLSVWFSHKRFKKKLEREREVDLHTRKWEVRGEPLLNLRAELACMASKLDRLVKMSFQSYGHANNQLKEEFERAKNDWSSYLLSDQLSKTLFLVDDKEIMALLQKGYALNRGRLWNRLGVEVIHLKRYRTCLDRTEDISR
jgi:hypothetical protein